MSKEAKQDTVAYLSFLVAAKKLAEAKRVSKEADSTASDAYHALVEAEEVASKTYLAAREAS